VAVASRGRVDEDPVRLYLNAIGKRALLSKEDERTLGRTIEIGHEAAEELARGEWSGSARRRELERERRAGEAASRTFVEANLRLVVSIAKKYQASDVPLLDLIQEGNLGLMHAVEKFDWRKGFKFSTYATWWIRQAITRGIATSGRTVRLPSHVGELLNQALRAREALEHQLGRRPTLPEIAAAVEVEPARIAEILIHSIEPRSLSEPLHEDGDLALGDLVRDPTAEPFEAAAASLLHDDVTRALTALDDREHAIVELRYGLDRGQPRTLDEVGAIFGLTRERIRQIEARALSKLRHPSHQRDALEQLTF
jgi:RNA polymerase sigma factor (sigma-70 family)